MHSQWKEWDRAGTAVHCGEVPPFLHGLLKISGILARSQPLQPLAEMTGGGWPKADSAPTTLAPTTLAPSTPVTCPVGRLDSEAHSQRYEIGGLVLSEVFVVDTRLSVFFS